MQSVSTFISLRTSTGIDCKNAYSSGPTIDSGNLRLKWCHSLVHAEPQTRQVPVPVPQNAPLATIHHRGPISRAATMCWKATSYSSDKITGIQPQCMLSLVERKTPQWPSTLQLNDTGHVRAEHQLLDPGLLLQSSSFYCSWFTCCKMMQNGHHTPMLCSRLVELVRPGRCASRNQAEVRAALHLEVVWYEATWVRWHYPVAQQNWRDQHGSTPHELKIGIEMGAQLISVDHGKVPTSNPSKSAICRIRSRTAQDS